MTTLDPSHIPWLAHSSDPTTGGAVHTSVRAPGLSIPGRFEHAASTDSELEADDDDADQDIDALDFIRKRRRARRARRRAEREQTLSAGRIPTLPLPDVRFEQSYLMSIQPFIHSRVDPTPSTSAIKPKTTREKRRRVEESLALVDDPAAPPASSNAMDALFSISADEKRLITVDWGSIAWITFRDQLVSPLVQGALWAFAGILWTGFRGYWSAKLPSRPSDGPGVLDRMFPSARLRPSRAV